MTFGAVIIRCAVGGHGKHINQETNTPRQVKNMEQPPCPVNVAVSVLQIDRDHKDRAHNDSPLHATAR